MKVTSITDKALQLDDCKIVFKNFSGKAGLYNKEGDKNFCIKIDDPAIVSQLQNCVNKEGKGWNVKLYTPKPNPQFKDQNLTPFNYLKVKVGTKFPTPIQIDIGGEASMCQDISSLDNLHIERADIDLAPYDGVVNGTPFRKAYLKGMKVYATKNSRFDAIDGQTESVQSVNSQATPQPADPNEDFENLDNVEIV